MMPCKFLSWERLWGTFWEEGHPHLQFHCWFSQEEKMDRDERNWKVGDQALGSFFFALLQSCLKVLCLHCWVTSQRMALPVPNLPLRTTKSYRFCLFTTSQITPVPRHWAVQVVTMTFLGNCPRPLTVCPPLDLPSFSNAFSIAREIAQNLLCYSPVWKSQV